MRVKNKSFNWVEKTAPYVLLTPLLFMLIVFFGFAFVRCLYFSFTNYDFFNPAKWVGFHNYLNLLTNARFGFALKNTLLFAATVTILQTCLALVLALFLNQKLRGIKYFRAIYYAPSVASSVVVTLIFTWIFQRKGLLNYLATLLAQNSPLILTFVLIMLICQTFLVLKEKWRKRPVSVLEPSFLAISLLISGFITFVLYKTEIIMPVTFFQPVETIWLNTRELWPKWLGPFAVARPLISIMMLNVWTTGPTFMLLYLAGLQEVPKELYEVSAVDGANGWHTYRYIIIPQLRNVTFLVVTMGLISTLQMFDQVAIVGTDMAPENSIITLAYFVYTNVFPPSAIPRVGMASAAAIFLSVLTLVIVLIQQKIIKRGSD